MDWITSPEAWIALVTLTALEIVLGIDNIVFISILVARLPAGQRDVARRLGLGLAMLSRIALLFSISWIVQLTTPIFSVMQHEVSGRDLILLLGGLFLLGKATFEIHDKLEGDETHARAPASPSFAGVIAQIIVLDMVFSLDSVITAVGMANDLAIMISAVVIAVGIMLVASGPISDFVNRHPTIRMLALAFLLLIGVSLMAEGLHFHIPKGYIYFAMAFSVLVELLNLRVIARHRNPVALHQSYVGDGGQGSSEGGTGTSPAPPDPRLPATSP
jgi:predicted tellurium resistance membrane protein TerC